MMMMMIIIIIVINTFCMPKLYHYEHSTCEFVLQSSCTCAGISVEPSNSHAPLIINCCSSSCAVHSEKTKFMF
jgi:hypothetical protein